MLVATGLLLSGACAPDEPTEVAFEIDESACKPACKLLRYDVFVHREMEDSGGQHCSAFSTTELSHVVGPKVVLPRGAVIWAGMAAYCPAKEGRTCCKPLELCIAGFFDECAAAIANCPDLDLGEGDAYFTASCTVRGACPACSARTRTVAELGDTVTLDLVEDASCAPVPVELRCPERELPW